jgi:hypothetical protein
MQGFSLLDNDRYVDHTVVVIDVNDRHGLVTRGIPTKRA